MRKLKLIYLHICLTSIRYRIAPPTKIHTLSLHDALPICANRAENIATARMLLDVAPPAVEAQEQPDVVPDSPRVLPSPCPCRSEEHTSELQSPYEIVCRLLLEKKKITCS